MQRTDSEYGSPYLATHHFPFPYIHTQVYLKQLEYCEKIDFFCNISKSEVFIYSRLITCKVKHFKSFFVCFNFGD